MKKCRTQREPASAMMTSHDSENKNIRYLQRRRSLSDSTSSGYVSDGIFILAVRQPENVNDDALRNSLAIDGV